jgi:hypothetical protein
MERELAKSEAQSVLKHAHLLYQMKYRRLQRNAAYCANPRCCTPLLLMDR